MNSLAPYQELAACPECLPIAVESSVLSAVTYLSDAKLELHFRNGAIYHYSAVPLVVVQALLAAPSKGAYFNRHIRDHFHHQRLR